MRETRSAVPRVPAPRFVLVDCGGSTRAAAASRCEAALSERARRQRRRESGKGRRRRGARAAATCGADRCCTR
eukprot:1469145-Rhodomonas_salina.2